MLDTTWSFACPDWEAKLRSGQTPIPDLPLDPVESGVAVALLDKLRLPDVPGQPTFGQVGGEWVRDIVRAAFGSVDPVTGVLKATFGGNVTSSVWARIDYEPKILAEYQSQDLVYTALMNPYDG